MLQFQPQQALPVRRLTVDDLPQALKLQQQVSAGVPDGFLRGKTESELHDSLRGLAGAAFGAFDGNALLAMGLLRLPGLGHANGGAAFPRVTKSDWPFHAAVLEHALVAPAARGHGLQRALIRARIAAARHAGMRWLCAGAQLANAASLRNLLSQGLVIVDGRFSHEQSVLALLLPLGKPGFATQAAHQRWVLVGDASGHEKALRAGYLGVRSAIGSTVLYQREVTDVAASNSNALPTSLHCPARP